MSTLLCQLCGKHALVIYERKPLCGPCAVEALDENHHYLVVQVEDEEPPAAEDDDAARSSALA